MNSDALVTTIENKVAELLQADPSVFLVDIKIKPSNNIRVFLDGDAGIPIETCAIINRALYKELEESGMFPNGDFSLEVSSAGLEEPLKLLRQYRKNIGRKVDVVLNSGVKTSGKLLEVTETGIVVEETRGKNKKQELIQHNISFEEIKSTKIQIVF